MFVITADQIDSLHGDDLAATTLRAIADDHGATLALPPDRNAGDEIQAITDDATTALALVLELTRDGRWSVGLGWGPVRTPLPAATREANGRAFAAAREAVTTAKRRPLRFAAVAPSPADGDIVAPGDLAPGDVDALLGPLLEIRSGRSASGWEVYDLLASRRTQQATADALGISAAAVGARARVAGLRVEEAAVPALQRLLTRADREAAAGASETTGDPASAGAPIVERNAARPGANATREARTETR